MKNFIIKSELDVRKANRYKKPCSIDFSESNRNAILPESFYCKDNIEKLIIPDSIEVIGDFAFSSNINLAKVYGQPKIIGNSAFKFNSKLKEFDFSRTTEIGDNAFEYSGLKKIDFGPGLKTIKTSSFAGCLHLKEIELSNVETIEHHAFSATGLLSVVLGNKLKRIGNQAFEGCLYLKNIVCLTPNPPRICESTFYGTNIQKIWVATPKSLEAFKNAKYWSEYADIMELIDWVAVSEYVSSLKLEDEQKSELIRNFCRIN